MTPRLHFLPIALGCIAVLTAGCEVGPDYHAPDVRLTPAFRTGQKPTSQATAQRPAPSTTSSQAWWNGFGDPALTTIIARASEQNLDLAQAKARLTQSRALARAAGAALAPSASATSDASKVRQSLQSPIGEIGRHLPGYERDYPEVSLGGAASWEIDIFGGLRRAQEAARAEAVASDDLFAAIHVSVQADAADAYLQVRALQARLTVAQRQATVESDLVALVRQRNGQGVSPEREDHEAQAALEGVNASIPPLRQSLEIQLNRLDVLMGVQPGTYRGELEAPAPIPSPPTLANSGRPADLLRRRADVAAAEEKLVAANAQIGAAVADYYPKLSLSALVGLDSVQTGRLFAGDAVQAQATGGLRWRLFDFGRVDAEVAQAKGRKTEALAAYRSTILRAAEEVENAFSDLTQQEARASALSRQIDELTVARRQAQEAYDGGVISLTEVRDADRDLLAASDQLAQAQGGAARAAVASYRALGGGWGGGPS